METSGMLYFMVYFSSLIGVLFLGGLWMTIKKIGLPGWSVLIPIWNFIVFFDAAKKPQWWTVFVILPPIFLIFYIIGLNGISRRYGKGAGFTIGLFFLPFVFFPILGMGKPEPIQ